MGRYIGYFCDSSGLDVVISLAQIKEIVRCLFRVVGIMLRKNALTTEGGGVKKSISCASKISFSAVKSETIPFFVLARLNDPINPLNPH